jgi:hypothetical protein
MSGSSTVFLHLASGSSAADVIRETLRRLGRGEVVIGMRDAYAEGPLRDVDEGARSRVEWWSRLRGKPLDAAEAGALNDADIGAQVRVAPDKVMLWHGPHPAERIFALRVCWHLRDQPDRLHEVALPATGRQWKGVLRPAFYDAIPVVGPNETVPAWERRARITDVTARAQRWEELRAQAGEWLRVLDDEEIVHRPVTAYDAELLACAHEWTESMLVIGRVLAENPTTDALLCWRIRELLRAGARDASAIAVYDLHAVRHRTRELDGANATQEQGETPAHQQDVLGLVRLPVPRRADPEGHEAPDHRSQSENAQNRARQLEIFVADVERRIPKTPWGRLRLNRFPIAERHGEWVIVGDHHVAGRAAHRLPCSQPTILACQSEDRETGASRREL